MSGGRYYKQANVACPYYINSNFSNKITCEGLMPGAVTISIFQDQADCERQIETYCSWCYWNCEICEALDRKYEDE